MASVLIQLQIFVPLIANTVILSIVLSVLALIFFLLAQFLDFLPVSAVVLQDITRHPRAALVAIVPV